MKLYDVWAERITGGRIRVQAESPDEAFQIAQNMDPDDWDVEWGSCGDSTEVINDVVEAYVPSYAADPEWTEYLRLRKKYTGG